MKRTLLLAVCTAALAAPTIAQDLPPGNPLPGECFARVIVPATYQTTSETIILREEGFELRKIPARFETVTERVLVQEASYEIVPAGSAEGTRLVPGVGAITVTIGGASYTIDSSRTVRDASGNVIGSVNGEGSIVGNNGQIIAQYAVNPLTLTGVGSGVTTTLKVGGKSYRVDSDLNVFTMNGRKVGTINRNGSII
ncbi:MAG TPA: hypothetical protein ENJ42_07120, partial [Hellea balneolensis]|nr:hypothetical protein [Hellea balneolensis]